ncbi:hypothetical protein MRX96_003447 [Rhipicephalus microplus]
MKIFLKSNPERKFRMRQKFGAIKVRQTLVTNFKKRTMIPQNPRDPTLSASHGNDVDATMESQTPTLVVTEPMQSPSVANFSSSNRMRQYYRQQSDLEEEQVKAEEKLSELSSTAAMEQ